MISLPSNQDIKDAAREVNDALMIKHKLSRRIPRDEICGLVDQWMDQNKNNASEVADIILFLENKSHRRCAYRHLEKLSGFKGSDHPSEEVPPLTKKELIEAIIYFFLALIFIVGLFLFLGCNNGNCTFAYISLGYLGILFVGGVVYQTLKSFLFRERD